jgi:Cu/Zn superoxide dismutase
VNIYRSVCILPTFFGLICASLPLAAQTVSAELKDIDGRDVGKATLIETPEGVLIRLSIKGLPAGVLAFHVHAVGDCEPPFLTGGPHFNPMAKKHGLEASDGAHAGDMPNLHIPPSGLLEVEVLNTPTTLIAFSTERSQPIYRFNYPPNLRWLLTPRLLMGSASPCRNRFCCAPTR